jgi:hypothetical protein
MMKLSFKTLRFLAAVLLPRQASEINTVGS